MRVLLGICAAVGSIAFGSSNAWALDTGQCLPASEVRAALAADNQTPIIVGNRTGYGYPVSLIFFSNGDGSRGYLVRGDKPLGQQAETVCVESVYRDVRLNDIAKPGVHSWAKVAGDRAGIAKICSREKLGYQEQCQASGDVLGSFERNGNRVMFMATGTAINPRDKSGRDDQHLLVLSNAAGKGGVEAVTPEGASYMLSAYTSISYTQSGSQMLDGAQR